MKTQLLGATSWFSAMLGLWAQGLVELSNAHWEAWPETVSRDRLIYVDVPGGTPVSDPTWTAQLWEVLQETNHRPVGAPTHFLGPPFEGIFANDGTQRVLSAPPHTPTSLQLRVYDGQGDLLGTSEVFSFTPGASIPPMPVDTLMVNFPGATIGSPTFNRLAWLADAQGGYFLRFAGIPGVSYRLQSAPEVTGPWRGGDPKTALQSGVIEFAVPNPAITQSFYRVAEAF